MAADLLAPQFQNVDSARAYLEALRWPKGPICPHCGVLGGHYKLEGKAHRPGLMKCKDCRSQFSVTVGTVFADSKVPLNKWLLAVHLLCASKKGMSSLQIKRMLGVTYKTAWFMTHRIREAMKSKPIAPLASNGGTVEADETFWGNKARRAYKHTGYEHKMKVLSLVERGGEKRSFVVPSVNSATLMPILHQQISAKANLMTDESGVYYHAKKSFASHERVNHRKDEYVRGNVHTNTVECSFSLLKRGLIGTFHHVGEQHLQRYVTEFDFRWNHRKTTDAERAELLLEQVHGKRLKYRL